MPLLEDPVAVLMDRSDIPVTGLVIDPDRTQAHNPVEDPVLHSGHSRPVKMKATIEPGTTFSQRAEREFSGSGSPLQATSQVYCASECTIFRRDSERGEGSLRIVGRN
jgi:hypothetical protein